MILPAQNAEFVCQMESVLEVYRYTPKHGNWLNMAEIALSILARQCLDRRLPEFDLLPTEVMAWVKQRNQKRTWID